CAVTSVDGGRHFGSERILLTCEEEHAVNIMSLSLLDLEDGDLGLFYLVRHTYTMMQMYMRRSNDGGETWGDRVLCTPQAGFFVVNNDRVVRLESGRILIPAACHRTGQEGENGTFLDYRSEVVFFYSDDDGRSWQAAEGKCCMPYVRNCTSGLQEPGVLELSPGILWGFARTDLGRQYEMFSLDNGNTWTGAEPSRFTSPNSPMSIKRDGTGAVWAVWNPIPEYNGRRKKTAIFTGGRTPYVIAVSRDNGQTFTEGTAFETEEDRGYCYCAICFLEDAMLLAYNAGGPEDGSCLARTRIRRIEWKELDILQEEKNEEKKYHE
ncbi:MAG: glycoside hydrolase, partial [Lachnospiraceae bacterium]|nr:glycoside hydrolase [Lachnospiraceae bacterium]